MPEPTRPRRTWLWVGLGLAALVLVALAVASLLVMRADVEGSRPIEVGGVPGSAPGTGGDGVIMLEE